MKLNFNKKESPAAAIIGASLFTSCFAAPVAGAQTAHDLHKGLHDRH